MQFLVAIGTCVCSQAAVVFGMGFATNALGIPGLMGAGTLVLSDENNHASLILGLRLARVTVRVFKHNDVRHLERLARDAIAEGGWKKIIVVTALRIFILPSGSKDLKLWRPKKFFDHDGDSSILKC